jgi:acyl-CoA thioesterase
MEEEKRLSPGEILRLMLNQDRFTEWLGLAIDEIRPGYCKLHFTVRKEMLNGFSNIHGGVIFSASDSAFAFACNSHGRIAVAMDASISFIRPVLLNELLTVEAKELYLGNKTGIYDIRTTNKRNELVAFFKGTAYRTSKITGRPR